jgi:hypothetical protein
MKQLNTMIHPDEYLRLECLKLALQLSMSNAPYVQMQALQERADAMLRYVHTGSMVIEPMPPPRYRMEEVASGET